MLLLLIICATLFMMLGYAAINSVIMSINGTALANAQDGVFITDVIYRENENTENELSKINSFYKTNLNNMVVLSSISLSSYITYEIVIYNNSSSVYEFTGVDYLTTEGMNDNSNIIYTLSGIENGDTILPISYLNFMITFKYAENDTQLTNNVLNSYLNFKFVKQYTVSYNNITNNNYPSTVKEGDNLVIEFTEPIPQTLIITIGDVETTDYVYQNNILTIQNISGNVIIESNDLGDFDIVVDDNNSTITDSNISTSSPVTPNNFANNTYTGINNSSKVIDSIKITINYVSSIGKNQTISSNLVVNGVTYTETISFSRASNSTTLTFNNLNIPVNSTFELSYAIVDVNNSKLSITGHTISIVYIE